MKPFALHISAFSISWLRAYDFGLEQEALESALLNLNDHPLVEHLTHLGSAKEIDEIDVSLFDVRYLNGTKLVRIALRPFQLVAQELGAERQLTTHVRGNLLMDEGSGFGVFNLCMPQPSSAEGASFSIEEITFLTRQWLLAKDPSGQPLHLKVRLPDLDKVESLYLREVMNYYFLQIHDSLWRAPGTDRDSEAVDQNWFLERCHEEAPIGCRYLRDLCERKRIQSLFPSSFGPVLNIWGIEGLDPDDFHGRSFSKDYARELSWLFTDGRNADLSGRIVELENEERRASRALFVWPNHAIYINQSPDHIQEVKVADRMGKYGLVDIEIVRIFEVLTLQGAMLHAFDSKLDEMLQEVSSGVAHDSETIIGIIAQRRRITRSIRTFDYFNLFHGGAQLEHLYRRLLDNSSLEYNAATELVEAKARRLDEEIDQSVIIQDRIRQRQQDEQELKILTGIHELSLANERQNRALASITIVVSAITALSIFTEVLLPLLTYLFPSISENPVWQVVLKSGILFMIFWGLRAWFRRGAK